ncbi:hypothetical protein COO03_04995 [Bacillus sp. AFS098217]|uniref:hypothetical protein n=1 Tax=Bacillus sp. AFS098217 TaxID=2033868 RepID=UPI000BED4B44|nr:hypothetical protein [Bacillus sp. AFS098217]PEB54599.1 hypothetical protein COO03_04995 [Bacillus sp. AFS098217]
MLVKLVVGREENYTLFVIDNNELATKLIGYIEDKEFSIHPNEKDAEIFIQEEKLKGRDVTAIYLHMEKPPHKQCPRCERITLKEEVSKEEIRFICTHCGYLDFQELLHKPN